MANADVFELRRSELNEFLFAHVGTEANGMPLSVISVFARLGEDPWCAAGKLAAMPQPEAIESLARTIAAMPANLWPPPAATMIATRLIALLPAAGWKSGQNLRASTTAMSAGDFLRIGIVALAIACAAYGGGLFSFTASLGGGASDAAGNIIPSR